MHSRKYSNNTADKLSVKMKVNCRSTSNDFGLAMVSEPVSRLKDSQVPEVSAEPNPGIMKRRTKSIDAKLAALLQNTKSASNFEGKEPHVSMPLIKRKELAQEKDGFLTKKIFHQLEDIQESNKKFIQTLQHPFFHNRHKSLGNHKPSKQIDPSDGQAFRLNHFKPVDSRPRKNNRSKLSSLSGHQKLSYNNVALYQLPNKDIFIQHTTHKRDENLMNNFTSLMKLKIENTAKNVEEELEKNDDLAGKSILCLKLAVVHFTGQMVYLERMFTTKALIDSYMHVYLKADRYSFGFSASNNKIMVRRILKFIINVNAKILILRCRDDQEMLEKYLSLHEFVRYDCSSTPEVYILDNNEIKLIEYLFFNFCPIFYGREIPVQSIPTGKVNMKDSQIDIPESSDRQPDKSDQKPQVLNHLQFMEARRSKWMAIIEQCLTKKDILTMNQDDFTNIFSEYTNHFKKPRKEIPEENETEEVEIAKKPPATKGIENLRRFREFIYSQIQVDREERVVRKLKVDYDEFDQDDK